jgi:hypothetical protein
MSNRSPKDLTGFIKCLSLFETNTARLYNELSDKVELPLIKSLLKEISLDSQKHAGLLQGVSESLPKTDWKPSECPAKLGEGRHLTEECYKEIAKKKKIATTELPELLKHLEALESVMGEEYNVFVQLKTLELLSEEIKHIYNINLEGLKSIFISIMEDEQHHSELLTLVKNMVNQKDQEMMVEDPLLRYRRIGVPTG